MAAAALNRTQERKANTSNGGMMLLLTLVVLAVLIWLVVDLIRYESAFNGFGTIVVATVFVLQLCGFYTLQPNEGAAITLFGNYKGTDRTPGLRWMLPWYTRKKISLRVRNVTGEKLKVNDKRGNPIEIAAVVVWRVTDTAQALFDVDHYQTFVDIQIETAVREIASHFAYDHSEHEEPTLRGDADQVSALLREKLQERVSVAGVVIDETKLSHLAYAPEIAGAMLRRQQAEAVLAARQKIVQGAVMMVESALAQLSERDIVKLDDERRATMVSNLLVVLCGDRDAQPVVNAGSLYQ
ncbi:MAG: SPFH domain-containing protein [Hyphomonadaceae bacterium]|nr:SPFH domain-containing protein [Hyphomonadaceae bacterium]